MNIQQQKHYFPDIFLIFNYLCYYKDYISTNYQCGKNKHSYVVVCAVFESFKYFQNVTLSNHNKTLMILDLVIYLPASVRCLLARAVDKPKHSE
jgi:hypothetical protein